MNYWNNGEFKDQLTLDTMRFKTLAEMFAAGREHAEGARICIAGWQRVSARRSGVPAGSGKRHIGLALSGQSRHLWVHLAHPGQQVYVSSESEDLTYSAQVNGRWHA